MAEKVDTERGMRSSPAEEVKFGDISNEALTPEEDKRILRKIDRWYVSSPDYALLPLECSTNAPRFTRLLPVMALSYLFQFLDKSALGFTAIMGLRTDLRLTGDEYSWSSGIYYFGYLVASYPAAMLMVRWKVGKVITMSV